MPSNVQKPQPGGLVDRWGIIASTLRLFPVAIGSFAIILVIAATTIYFPDYECLSTWIAFVFMCAVPFQLVMGMLWHTNYPAFLKGLGQPVKGCLLTLMTAGVAGFISTILFHTVGGSVGPPTPMLSNYSVMTIVVTFWLLPVMNCWPASKFTNHPLALGAWILVACYGLAYVLYQVFFDFSPLAAAPSYVEALDPKGMFNNASALSFFVTTSIFILMLLLSEMKLVTAVVGEHAQPVAGLIITTVVMLATACCWFFFVKVLGLDPMIYMARVPVCTLFGIFLVDSMMQHRMFEGMAQPTRGIALSIGAVIYGIVMYYVYAAAGPVLAKTALLSGPPHYGMELWIANSLLGITFPIIVMVTAYFDFWPVKKQ